MATEAVSHGLLFGAIIMFVKHKKDEVGMVKFISGDGGGTETVRSNEEGDFSDTEGGGAGVGYAPVVYYKLEKGKEDKKVEVNYGLVWRREFGV